MKLDEITIHQFRGLKDLVLSGLSRVNLLVGPNDSGKTSILEAVAAFSRPLDVQVWLNATWRREILHPEEDISQKLEWMFPHETNSTNGSFSEAKTRVTGSGTFEVKEARASYKRMSRIRARSPREGADYEQPGALLDLSVSYESVGQRRDHTLKYELWEGEDILLHVESERFSLPAQTVTPVTHRAEYGQVHLLSQAAITGVKPELLALLQNVDSDIRDVQILSPKGKNSILYIDYAHVGLIPLTAFGDGVRRALLIALDLQSAAGGVLLIDEIEASIHVTALGPMFSWIVKSCEKLDIQLFATTHSLEAVDAIVQAEANNLNLITGYRLERRMGPVEAQRIDGELLYRLRHERGLDVRL